MTPTTIIIGAVALYIVLLIILRVTLTWGQDDTDTKWNHTKENK